MAKKAVKKKAARKKKKKAAENGTRPVSPQIGGYSRYKPISDYGIIGDLHTAALVGKDGSIDWCCLPSFDSPSVFAAILDADKGGYFKISPVNDAVQKQMYLPETCILITRFLATEGVAEVCDFMTVETRDNQDPNHEIVRIVRVISGEMKLKVVCFPSFNYGLQSPEVHIRKGGAVFSSSKERVGLTSSVTLVKEKGGASAEFKMNAGEEKTFVLRQCPDDEGTILDPTYDTHQAFEETINYWRSWVKGIQYEGRWREMVQRSAMTLKILTYAPTGAIVAAPTTSLPETIGGARNFDYRYTWIRDAAFTVYAFLRLGLTREADQFINFISARAHESEKTGELQIMYGIHGEHELPEKELKHLEGYKKSSPVRIGNLAAEQLQLDIYGELMDSIYLSNKHSTPVSYDLWLHLRKIVDYVCENWNRKDEGIWEIRGGKHHFTYSKVMCWVALDRAIRLAEKRSFPCDRERWYKVRDTIYEDVMNKGWSSKTESFVQHYDNTAIDASSLIMPLVFFIAPTDPRMIKTVEAAMKELASDALVHRYKQEKAASDGFEGEEGSFSMCSFWLVECLTRAGRVDEARLLFEKMHSYANHLGLYSEEIGKTGELLGNFPQAFTHMSLISAAFNLDRALGGQE